MGLRNVILLGLAFLLLFTAYNTAQNLLTSVLPASLGFVSLCIVYATIVVGKPLAPSIVARLGERRAMFFAAFCYVAYVAALIEINEIAIYVASVVLGLGASVLWVGQGSYLTLNSSRETRGKNACALLDCVWSDATLTYQRTNASRSGIFWAIFQVSGIIGNLGVFAINRFTDWPFSYEAIGLTVQTSCWVLFVFEATYCGRRALRCSEHSFCSRSARPTSPPTPPT